jgi:hypothetical protein
MVIAQSIGNFLCELIQFWYHILIVVVVVVVGLSGRNRFCCVQVGRLLSLKPDPGGNISHC